MIMSYQANKVFLCACPSLLLMGGLLPRKICWDLSQICFVNIPTFRLNLTLLFSLFAFFPQGCLHSLFLFVFRSR